MLQWPTLPIFSLQCCAQTGRWAALSQLAEDTGADMLERGTRVTLHLKDDAAEYAGDKRLGELIKQYSEFIAFPIKLWAEKCALFGADAQCFGISMRSKGIAPGNTVLDATLHYMCGVPSNHRPS